MPAFGYAKEEPYGASLKRNAVSVLGKQNKSTEGSVPSAVPGTRRLGTGLCGARGVTAVGRVYALVQKMLCSPF